MPNFVTRSYDADLWQLVPKMPTREMVDAARNDHEGELYLPNSLYIAMLKHAPQPASYSVGERIRFARAKLGWSQQRLASELLIANTQMSRYETGRSEPRIVMVEKIANVLGVTPQWLLYGIESRIAAEANHV